MARRSENTPSTGQSDTSDGTERQRGTAPADEGRGALTHSARRGRTPAATRRRREPADAHAVHEPARYRQPQLTAREDSPFARSLVPMPPGVEVLDSILRANFAQFTANLSPASIALAYADWATHLLTAPGKQLELGVKALRKAVRLGSYAIQTAAQPECEPCIDPLPHDHRFDGAEWRRFPHNLIYQSFLLAQQWWWNATTGVHGVAPAHEKRMQFMTRQLLDTVAPSNFPWSNPRVIDATARSLGTNFLRGAENMMEDQRRQMSGLPPVGAEAFRPGQEVAATPGKVVYRNRLIELIQYAPTSKTVYPEPILIVPAWIMKYYVLDLSQHNSLIRYLVDQGHTVFCISWHNPTPEDRELSLEDYRRLGPVAARRAIEAIMPNRQIHAMGYCIGGTLLTIEAARMARDGEDEFASITLLAAQVDFTEPGELELFIDESEISYLEDVMWSKGYLDTREMAGAFQLLRSSDLIWSRMIQEYLLGERQPMIDLMAWNADATRMPYRMHTQYLRRLFLANELAHGRYEIEQRPVALPDIGAPIFAVATETDHVAPWRSVYKIHLLTDTEVSFVLTSGGHNAGIVSEPGHPRRYFRIHRTAYNAPYRDPDVWTAQAELREGSWWPAWHAWLAERSGSRRSPPRLGDADAGYPPLADAPGSYVHER